MTDQGRTLIEESCHVTYAGKIGRRNMWDCHICYSLTTAPFDHYERGHRG